MEPDCIYFPFLICSQKCTEIFWKNIFENLAQGKAPYPTKINKTHLYSFVDGYKFTLKYVDMNTDDLYSKVKTIFTDKLGIVPVSNLSLNIQTDFDPDPVKNFKRKCNREIMINNFLFKLMNLHKIDIKQIQFLHTYITSSIMLKLLNIDDFEFENNEIVSINAVDIVNGKLRIKRNIEKYFCNDDDEETLGIEKRKSLSDNWYSFVRKHSSKYNFE